MNVLLDTHVWLWHLLGSKELNSNHKKLLEDESTEVWLSPISLWEAHLLIERKRVPLTVSAGEWIEEALNFFPIKEAKLSFAISRKSREISLATDDPADRFIAATAAELKLTLLTSDKKLKQCKDITCA